MFERAERSHPTSRILQVLYILFFLVLSVEGEKSQANITIAFLGPYLAFPGIKLKGNLVTSYTYFGRNIVRYNGLASNLGLVIWNDVGAQMAVDLINKSPDILPNATLLVKRFNDLDPEYSHDGSGYAMQLAMTIQEQHPDVVAVYGGFGITSTLLTSALYSKFQLPHCASMISAPDFDNPNNRPYYFSLLPNTGSGTALCILLNQWNVKRLALITDSGSPDLVSSFNQCNIRIVTLSTVRDTTSISEITSIGNLIKHYDLRYIVLDAGSRTSGLVYFTFAAKNILFGPGYVWLATTTPLPVENGKSLLGPAYNSSLVDGLFAVSSGNPAISYYDSLLQKFVDNANTYTKPLGKTYSQSTLNPLGGLVAFDCIGVLASGISAIMEQTSPKYVSQRKAQNLMNYTAFTDSKYRGFSGDPIKLRPSADILTSFLAFRFNSYYDSKPFAWLYLETSSISYFSRQLQVFAGNTTIPPPDGPIFTTVYLERDSEYGYVILFFEVSGLLMCGIDILVTLCFKHTKAVRSQIPSFNFITVIGAILGYSSSFLQFGRPTIGNCIGNAWLLSLCFVMVSASISLKNAKLGLIYNAKTKLPKIYMQETIWILLVSGFVILDAIFLSIWTWKANIYVSISTDFSALTTEYTCATKKHIMEYILIAYYVILGILCSYSAYMARNVTGIHSNSSFTFIIVLSTIIFLTIGELISSSSSSTVSKIFVRTLIAYILLTEVILFKLVNKIIGVWRESDLSVKIKLLLKNRSSVGGSVAGIYSSKMQAQSQGQSSIRIKSRNNEVSECKDKRKASEASGNPKPKTFVKGVKVVYSDNRFWSEWVTAICVLTKIGNGCVLVMIPPEGESKAFRLAETDCRLISEEGLIRVIAYCSGPIPEINIDFTAVEKAEGFINEIAKCKKELQ